jgi:hypothetical protein
MPEPAAAAEAGNATSASTSAAANAAYQQQQLAALLDPKTAFIEDVPGFLAARKLEPEAAILDLQERMRALRSLEGSVAGRRARALQKVPEIRAALAAVDGLVRRRGEEPNSGGDGGGGDGEEEEGGKPRVTHVDYALSDGVFARAALRGDTAAVGLWLGAGVMVEYPLDEAKALLEGNLSAAEQSAEQLGKDLDRVKDGLTVTEVSIARVFNYDVERRRRAKEAAGGGAGAGGAGSGAGAAAVVPAAAG